MSNGQASKGMRTTLVAVVINIVLAAVKGIAGVVGHSYALIADAVESTMDILSSLVVWSGLRIASVPPDKDHPYGHGKAEPLAAIMVALALVGAAVGIAIQSIREIANPVYAPAPFTIFVLVGVIITKESLFQFVFKTGQDIDSTALKTDAWHHRSDALTSTAAFIGIAVALIGGEGYESADDWAALFASGIIAFNGYRLIRPAIAEVMDAAPAPEIEDQIRRVASEVEGVIRLHKCFVRKMGFNLYVDIHVIVDGDLPVSRGHEIAHDVKEALRQSNSKITDVLVHIEPPI
ncbi:MAG: cation transporter [Planctomycetota bacterium]|nr:MAG: cation transporter [Planctomycetota bacterium]